MNQHIVDWWVEALKNRCDDHEKRVRYCLVSLAGELAAERDVEIEKLRREVEYLRHYGNKDCTAMADDAMSKGTLDEEGGL